jgi:hypothetical protein
MMAVGDHETFELGPLTLQRGLTLPKAHIAYKTYGTLAPDNSNFILYPTSYGAHHTDIEMVHWAGTRARFRALLHHHSEPVRQRAVDIAEQPGRAVWFSGAAGNPMPVLKKSLVLSTDDAPELDRVWKA